MQTQAIEGEVKEGETRRDAKQCKWCFTLCNEAGKRYSLSRNSYMSSTYGTSWIAYKKKKKNYTWYSPRERRKGTKKKIGLDRRPKGLDAQFKSNSVLASFLSHWMTVVSSLWNIHGNNTGSYAQQRCPGLMSPIALVLSGKTGQGEF